MAVRIQCPHCGTSYMVMNGVEREENDCPRCRRKFLPTVAPRPAVPSPAPASPRPTPGAPTTPAPQRNLFLGVLLILAAWVLGPSAMFGAYLLTHTLTWYQSILMAVPMALGTALAGWLLIHGRRMVARHGQDAMDADPRPPVLLLRSFADDLMTFEQLNNTMFGNRIVTFEEALGDICSWYGPVIAIGRPGENLPPLGAARLWVDHTGWQQKVTDLLHKCSVVVMIMGAIKGRDGLAWEVETIRQRGALSKLILVVPPLKNEDEIKARWRSYEVLTRGQLPPGRGDEVVVTFDSTGTCSVERLSSGGSKGARDRNTYKRLLHAALTPMAGKPTQPWTAWVLWFVEKISFVLVVVTLFVIVTLWKGYYDVQKLEQEERIRRLTNPSFPSQPWNPRQPWER